MVHSSGAVIFLIAVTLGISEISVDFTAQGHAISLRSNIDHSEMDFLPALLSIHWVST